MFRAIVANSNSRDYEIDIYVKRKYASGSIRHRMLFNWVLSETSAEAAQTFAEEIVSGYTADELIKELTTGIGSWDIEDAQNLLQRLDDDFHFSTDENNDYGDIGLECACGAFMYTVRMLRN